MTLFGGQEISIKLKGKKLHDIFLYCNLLLYFPRTRGASSTDIVILIVDACEGVLEQTVESLRIIRQTRVPFIVAINKIDKPGADVAKTKKQFTFPYRWRAPFST